MEPENQKDKRVKIRPSWVSSVRSIDLTKPKSKRSAGPVLCHTKSSTSAYSLIMSGSGDNTATESGVAKTIANEFEIELGHGIAEEDKLLSRRDKNAVDFAFNYSKLWCKSCKDLVFSLEKRAFAENEATRSIVKQFQILESSINSVNGAPWKQEAIQLSRMMIEQSKEIELHNNKRCRELLEVLTRQRTHFAKTRKFLKDKWKADMKRMIDAENSLIKTKTAYYQRCQTGVKLREELVLAQALLNETTAAAASCPLVVGTSGTTSGAPTASSGVTGLNSSSTAGNLTNGSLASESTGSALGAASGAGTPTGNASVTNSCVNLAVGDGPSGSEVALGSGDPTVTAAASAQIAKQKVKVERLEKQLSDNDKKEFELMYAYREAVETANHRLYELEKSKVEILCDTRLTITKSDEVVKDSLAELFHHLHTTRMAMLKQYDSMAVAFQDYSPCSDYRALVDAHVQKGSDTVPEKYHFDGFHEPASMRDLKDNRPETLSGRFVNRFSSSIGREAGDTSADPLSTPRSLLGSHSDSDSDGEDILSSTSVVGRTGGTGGSGGGSGGAGLVSTGSTVLSSLVEFGSNLFRQDAKKSVRLKRAAGSSVGTTSSAVGTGSGTAGGSGGGSANADSSDSVATQEAANFERECIAACYPVARCIAAIERQPGGLTTHGIYRVPASKAKVASLLDLLQSSPPTVSRQDLEVELKVLCEEHPITLASLVKTRLIALPESLLTYNLYPNFVELGKAFDGVDPTTTDDIVKRLRILISHLSPGNRQLAGLIFHHLHRVAACQSENQMGSANLGTMFGPTVLRQRPKFQVANMMEFVDNKGQVRVVELLTDRVVDIFGPADQYSAEAILTNPNHLLSPGREASSVVNPTTTTTTADTTHQEDSPRHSTLSARSSTASQESTTVPFSSNASFKSNLPASTAGYTGRSPTLVGNPLPLYTPFRANYSPTTSALTSNESVGSAVVGDKVLKPIPQVITTATVPTTGSLTSSSSTASLSSITPNRWSTSSSGQQSQTHLNFQQFNSKPTSGGTLTTASSPTTTTSRPSLGRQTTLQPRSSTAGDSTSALSSLVIGRRKPLAKMLATTTHPDKTFSQSDGPALNSQPTTQKGLDLDDCCYIDTDPSDS